MNTRLLQYEVDGWMRMLRFIKEDNVYLKNRLARIVRNRVNKDVLEHSEYYQNIFLTIDTIIELFIMDIKQHEQALCNGYTPEIKTAHEILKRDAAKFEREFYRQKLDFLAFTESVLENLMAA